MGENTFFAGMIESESKIAFMGRKCIARSSTNIGCLLEMKELFGFSHLFIILGFIKKQS